MIFVLDTGTVLIFITVFLAAWLYWSTRVPKGFPPGPPKLPLIGNMHTFAANRATNHIMVTQLAQQYGPIVGFKIGSRYAVFLCTLEVIQEALLKKGDAFSCRPTWLYFLQKMAVKNGKVRGVIFQKGEQWRALRRFTLQSLRDFGVGKRSIEERIQEEAECVCGVMATDASVPFSMTLLLQQAVSNIICSICFGSRFAYSSPEFKRLVEMINTIASSGSIAAPANFFPWMRYLPLKDRFEDVLSCIESIDAFVGEQIDVHRQTFQPHQIRDFVDLYLAKELEGHEDEETFGSHNMRRVINDLFLAGTETASLTLRWLLIYMIRYPDVQTKCQQEIDDVIGGSRRPCLDDRVNLPYVNATLHEVQRIANVTPFGVPRSTNEDTNLHGYTIPKHSLVLLNIYAVHMSDKYWDKPEEFRPERWIGSDGLFQKNDAFIPFSMGPRTCLGEMVAKSELFLFFCFFLQRFTIKAGDPKNPPSFTGKFGLSLSAQPFEVIAMSR